MRIGFSKMFSHVFMSGKEGCYAEFVSVLFAWFYGRVGPEGHDGEVLIASVHFNPQSVEKATSVAQLHSSLVVSILEVSPPSD